MTTIYIVDTEMCKEHSTNMALAKSWLGMELGRKYAPGVQQLDASGTDNNNNTIANATTLVRPNLCYTIA